MIISTSSGLFGPFTDVIDHPDLLSCDGADLPKSVIGAYQLVSTTPPADFSAQKYSWNGSAFVRNPDTAEEISEREAMVADKIDQIWRAADSYVNSYISGVAVGLLTIGVIQNKTKALAVTAWSSSVWDDYYTRKAGVTADSVLDLNFSAHGPMPYTVPELRAELGL